MKTTALKSFPIALAFIFLMSCQQKISEQKTSGRQPVKPDKEASARAKLSLEQKKEAEEVIIHDSPAPAMEKISSIPHGRSAVRDEMLIGGSQSIRCLGSANFTDHNTESYNRIVENEFLTARENPLSTFSIDVDGASYSNSRRYINNGALPPADAVRIEEFINYFDYSYPGPKGKEPFSITTEISDCPWNKDNKLIHVGIQGKTIPFAEIAPMNLVFLIDVSGSMDEPGKLPLVKSSLRLLVGRMRASDRISLVVYAGAAGLVLSPTPGNEKETIYEAIDRLKAGGSTAGGAGLKLAYAVARQNYLENGINRVLLATDGDFNVGVSSDAEMTRLVEEKRRQGVFISVLGFGMGNYKDSKMEAIADNGNGNYFYIDNIEEARKVLVTELDGTLYTIAKDVKLQVEFNPAKVKAYRLVGYENRMLKKEDFNNDKKDAGELGAGHNVTALYEVVPAGKSSPASPMDELKYQQTQINKNAHGSAEIMTIKFRYKEPKDSTSKLIVHTLTDKEIPFDRTSDNFRFSAAAASFGMLLRDSPFKGSSGFEEVIQWANSAKGTDPEGYRAEFVKLVKTARLLKDHARKDE
jgi:Ca-activated chloride channel homolog